MLIGFGRAGAQVQPAEAEEAQSTHLVAEERAARGLPAYAVAGDLVAVARRHATEMAGRGALYRNRNLPSEVARWRVLGENVSVGTDVAQIHAELMRSPTHRREILSTRFTEMGVGAAPVARALLVAVVLAQFVTVRRLRPLPAGGRAPAVKSVPPRR